MDKIIINGNGAVRVDGRYIHYKDGVPVHIPESAAKGTGKEYKVIEKYKTTVVSGSENRKTSKPEDNYPAHKGGGYYELSNGEKVRGKEKAIKAQKKLEPDTN